MKYRTLGRSAWNVSEIGFGGWGIGRSWWGKTDDKESIKALKTAWDCGINFFDTAYVYGDGHSEKLMGENLPREAIIATKIPPKNNEWPASPKTSCSKAFPAKWILDCTERSLKNLGREQIDLTQFHVWTDAWLDDEGWQGAIEKLKQDGKIRAFGVSINDHDPNSAVKLVSSGLADTVQVIFNIFDQSPLERLFPLCQQKQVGVIARVPFDEGGLTGMLSKDMKFEGDDFRKQYFKGNNLTETIQRVEKLKAFIGDGTHSLPELALRFILSHKVVSSVIPGMRKTKHVLDNVGVAGSVLPPALVNELHAHAWKRNFYAMWEE